MNLGQRTYTVVAPEIGSAGLGDILVMMKCSVNNPNIIYELPAKAARFAQLFYGIAPVKVCYDETVATSPLACFPPYRIGLQELEAARTLLGVLPKIPLALKINCAPAWAHLREGDPGQWQRLVNLLSDRYCVIQFGTSSNHTPLKGAAQLIDLPIRQLAATYAAIGRYVGVDTGDMHLALAAGAKCWVARPDDCSDYRYSDWGYQNPAIKYFPLLNPELINDAL